MGAAMQARAFALVIVPVVAGAFLAACSLLVDMGGLSTRGDAGASPPVDGGRDAAPSDGAPSDGSPPDDVVDPPTYRGAVLASKPAGYYRLGDPPGTTAKDESANARDGTYTGEVTFGVPGALANDPDTAVRFAPLASVDLGSSFESPGRAALSVEVWINPAASAVPYRHVFTKQHRPTNDKRGLAMLLRTDGILFERFVAGVGIEVNGGLLPMGSWSHVAGTYDGTTLRVYVDGVEKATASDVRDLPAVTESALIGFAEGSSTSFDGAIDEVAVWSEAIPAATIAAHYARGRN